MPLFSLYSELFCSAMQDFKSKTIVTEHEKKQRTHESFMEIIIYSAFHKSIKTQPDNPNSVTLCDTV